MRFLFSALMTLMLCVGARGALYSYSYSSGFQNGGVIPDGSLSGLADTRTISGITLPTISSITVSLNVSGGYNGDLYAYLSHGTTGFAVLLNRVGVGTINGGDAFGYDTAGFNITLATTGSDIHWVANPTSGGTYLADGRNINPLSSTSAFDANGTAGLSSFGGMDPNGSWTLFFADVASGGGAPTLVSWSLDITAIPEPVNVALGVFAGLLVGLGLARSGALGKVWERLRLWLQGKRAMQMVAR